MYVLSIAGIATATRAHSRAQFVGAALQQSSREESSPSCTLQLPTTYQYEYPCLQLGVESWKRKIASQLQYSMHLLARGWLEQYHLLCSGTHRRVSIDDPNTFDGGCAGPIMEPIQCSP
jgi:hypothetical protein